VSLEQTPGMHMPRHRHKDPSCCSPLRRELAGSTDRLEMLLSPTERLVRRTFLLTHTSLMFVSISSPTTPLLPLVSSTWS
jgi:hypothetical protein